MENHRILNDLVHKMDETRVSAMANLFLLETDSPLVRLPDIRGYNLYYGWYVGDMEDNDTWFDDFHAKYPDTLIGLTEYGADSVITLQSPKPEKGDFTESYQAVYNEHMLEMFSTRPYIWGTYCWNMFEFAAAGGMGEGVQINPAMQAMIARQPLKKILQQGGFELDEKQLASLNQMLNNIPVNKYDAKAYAGKRYGLSGYQKGANHFEKNILQPP